MSEQKIDSTRYPGWRYTSDPSSETGYRGIVIKGPSEEPGEGWYEHPAEIPDEDTQTSAIPESTILVELDMAEEIEPPAEHCVPVDVEQVDVEIEPPTVRETTKPRGRPSGSKNKPKNIPGVEAVGEK